MRRKSNKSSNIGLDAALETRFRNLAEPLPSIERQRLDRIAPNDGTGDSKTTVVPPPAPDELVGRPPPPPVEFEKRSWLENFRGPDVPAVERVMHRVEPDYFPIDVPKESIPYVRISGPTKRKVDLKDESTADSDIAVVEIERRSSTASSAVGLENDLSKTVSHRIETSQGEIWVSGSSLLCKCPDCEAPMTIRLWLRLADCWRCSTSIALDEETVEKAAKLLRSKPLPKPPPSPAEFYSRKPLSTVDPVVASPVVSGVAVDPRRSEFDRLTEGSFLARTIRRGFSVTPAWLVSFFLHLIALLILAMIILGDSSSIRESITLSTFLSADDEVGGDVRLENPLDTLQDDLAIASKMDVSEQEMREMIRDSMELREDPDSFSLLPDLDEMQKNLTTRPDQRMSFAARDPRVRAEIVEQAGGTNLTEASVARGLRWLASVQNDDGSWSLENYSKSKRKNNPGDTMGTALALLPFLGAGQTHEFGVYKQTVASGLRWLMETQKANGDFRNDPHSQAGMYAHGQAAIVICEALALTGDQQFFDPAQRSIEFIEIAQHKEGGWRYKPGQPGDTSVLGWQMMALQSARAPRLNLRVDDSTLRLADLFLDSVSSPVKRNGQTLPTGSTYCYMKGRPPTETMTAEAILCRMYLGWKKDDPRLVAAVNWLISEHTPSPRDKNLYYWYYGTQVMHHFGGQPWETWNHQMRDLLVSTQDRNGKYPGSWNPKGFEWGKKGGRIYTTSMAVCTLEVYYRHLPLFNPIDLEAARDF
jgi:hypothetical protein